MMTISGRPGVKAFAPSCILRVQGKAQFARPAARRCRLPARAGNSEPQLLEKKESADGATVFTFGSPSDKPAASKPSSTPAPKAASASSSNSEESKPAPPAPEKKIRPPPKDGNYSGYEIEELREYAKQRGIQGYQKLRKQPLIDTLKRNERWKVKH